MGWGYITLEAEAYLRYYAAAQGLCGAFDQQLTEHEVYQLWKMGVGIREMHNRLLAIKGHKDGKRE